MIVGLFGALLLYMIMATGIFVIVNMLMCNLFDIRNSVSIPVAFVAGLLFPVTIVLLFVSLPFVFIFIFVAWYVRNFI